MAGVDINEERLELATDTCQPQEFELGPNLRVNELSIDIFKGSVAEADQRMVGYDALACLEVYGNETRIPLSIHFFSNAPVYVVSQRDMIVDLVLAFAV